MSLSISLCFCLCLCCWYKFCLVCGRFFTSTVHSLNTHTHTHTRWYLFLYYIILPQVAQIVSSCPCSKIHTACPGLCQPTRSHEVCPSNIQVMSNINFYVHSIQFKMLRNIKINFSTHDAVIKCNICFLGHQ